MKNTTHKIVFTTLFALIFLSGMAAPRAPVANVIHVPGDYPTIQEAINVAQDGYTIIVAPGTFNETIDFLGKEIHLRSSDGPEVTVIDGTGLGGDVVTITGVPNPTLEGFTITGGQHGLLINFSGPTVINCAFVENAVDGARVSWMGVGEDQTATFVDCTFHANGGRGFAAALGFANPTDIFITGSTFSENASAGIMTWSEVAGVFTLTVNDSVVHQHSGWGIRVAGFWEVNTSGTLFENNSWGAMALIVESHGESPTAHIHDCTFAGNSTNSNGGAIHMHCAWNPHMGDVGCADVHITDSTFSENSALGFGGAISNRCVETDQGFVCGELTIAGSTFIQNVAESGGGAIAALDESFATIETTFLCQNSPDHIFGDWIDNGETVFAKMADFNCDGKVDGADLGILLANWGDCDECDDCIGDINGDCKVDGADLGILLANWG